MKREKWLIGVIIALSLCLVGVCCYLVIDKPCFNISTCEKNDINNGSKKQDNNQADNKDTDSDYENSLVGSSQSIESHLIFDFETHYHDESFGVVVTEKIDEEKDWIRYETISYHGKAIWNRTCDVLEVLWKVYLVGDTIMYVTLHSDTIVSITFIDLDGNQVYELTEFSPIVNSKENPINDEKNELSLWPNSTIVVDDNRIFWNARPYVSRCTALGKWRDDEIVNAVYQIKYLGNKKFSNVELLLSNDFASFCTP